MSLVLKTIRFGAVIAFLTNNALLKGAENDASNQLGEWPTYRGNTAGTGYSALEQVNAANLSSLGYFMEVFASQRLFRKPKRAKLSGHANSC